MAGRLCATRWYSIVCAASCRVCARVFRVLCARGRRRCRPFVYVTLLITLFAMARHSFVRCGGTRSSRQHTNYAPHAKQQTTQHNNRRHRQTASSQRIWPYCCRAEACGLNDNCVFGGASGAHSCQFGVIGVQICLPMHSVYYQV